MKKSKIVILIVVFIVIAAVVGGGTAFLVIKLNNDDKSSKQEENSYSNTTTQENTKKSSNSSSVSNNTNEKKTMKYTHIAVQGCVIISSDSKTGAVSYKKKCESCGNVDSVGNSTYLTGGTMNTSYYCPKCKKTQSVKIETKATYE